MIKQGKAPKNTFREDVLANQIVDAFVTEIATSKLSFFSMEAMRDMVSEFASSEQRNMGEIKQIYARESDKKYADCKKDIGQFQDRNKKQFTRIY